jgi:hypothetical protein
MALQQSNTTCDIYRMGNAPPNPPDVAGVPILLTVDFARDHEAAVQSGGASATAWRWTHTGLVGPTVDVRDGYAPAAQGQDGTPSNPDTLFVPDKSGTAFWVMFVARLGRGTPADCKQLLLQRKAVSWPSDNV